MKIDSEEGIISKCQKEEAPFSRTKWPEKTPKKEGSMARISRNALCPCNSGKKYKKCCLSKDEQRSRNKQDSDSIQHDLMNRYRVFSDDIAALDNLSNSVVDFINEGRLDEAEAACKELLRCYPDDIDGLERSAMVYEAKGNKEKAVEYYEKSIAYARSHPGFDPEFFEWAEAKIQKNKDTKRDGRIINFECKKCRKEFDCYVGQVAINEETLRPDFEKPIVCPRCGERSIAEVLLTELGQSQMTEATWNL